MVSFQLAIISMIMLAITIGNTQNAGKPEKFACPRNQSKHFCHKLADCNKDRTGTYRCTCKKGYQGNAEKMCTDIDECSTFKACHVFAKCANLIGSFSCTCHIGYRGDGETCDDINECLESLHDCPSIDMCKNNLGGFSCYGNTHLKLEDLLFSRKQIITIIASSVGGVTCLCILCITIQHCHTKITKRRELKENEKQKRLEEYYAEHDDSEGGNLHAFGDMQLNLSDHSLTKIRRLMEKDKGSPGGLSTPGKRQREAMSTSQTNLAFGLVSGVTELFANEYAQKPNTSSMMSKKFQKSQENDDVIDAVGEVITGAYDAFYQQLFQDDSSNENFQETKQYKP